MSSIGPTNPYHLARAYRLAPADRPGEARAPERRAVPGRGDAAMRLATNSERAAAMPAVAPASPVREAQGTRRGADARAATLADSPTATPSAAARLVAGVVPGRIDFTEPQPRQRGDAIALYRHPADKNAAATGVQAGRVIDVRG